MRLRVSQHARLVPYDISVKCILIAALHRSAGRLQLTRINKTKMAIAKREVSAQRFRKQLLISLPLSRPIARLIMNALLRRAADDQATRIFTFFLFSSRWLLRRLPYSSYRVIQKSCNRCATILIRALFCAVASYDCVRK